MPAWMQKLLGWLGGPDEDEGDPGPAAGAEAPIHLVALVNSQRFAAGATLLYRSPALDARAREAAHGLALESRPVRSLGGTPEDGLARHGYRALTAHRLEATGPADPAGAVRAWLDNPATAAALLSPAYRECGSAVATDAAGRRVYVLVLARARTHI